MLKSHRRNGMVYWWGFCEKSWKNENFSIFFWSEFQTKNDVFFGVFVQISKSTPVVCPNEPIFIPRGLSYYTFVFHIPLTNATEP